MVSQLVLLEPAPADWARAYQRLALEHPILAERQGRERSGTSLGGMLSMFALSAVALVGLNAWSAWQRDEWQTVGLSAVGLIAVCLLGLGVYLRFGRRELHDPKLVQEKLMRDAYRAELRIAVIAPTHVHPRNCRLAWIASERPTGRLRWPRVIAFVPRQVKSGTADLRILAPLARAALLNVRELAGLWHLPQAADDVPFVERTTARRRLPLPATVAAGPDGEGCTIGTSDHQGHSVSVTLPPGLLERHLLAIAKTRRGKSSLMLQLVHQLMLAGTTGLAVALLVPGSAASSWWIRTATWRQPRWASFHPSARTTLFTWTSPIAGDRSASTSWMLAWAGTATRRWEMRCACSGASSMPSGARGWRMRSASR